MQDMCNDGISYDQSCNDSREFILYSLTIIRQINQPPTICLNAFVVTRNYVRQYKYKIKNQIFTVMPLPQVWYS